jgi:hypothetical protein
MFSPSEKLPVERLPSKSPETTKTTMSPILKMVNPLKEHDLRIVELLNDKAGGWKNAVAHHIGNYQDRGQKLADLSFQVFTAESVLHGVLLL